ncbi:L-histidine N(alpha)-methyltransferase [Aureisphaera galaxeae]|uniref:L-histidine N(alpha)-methyltransferase n=1 Tax=Aureisphaera galaxeae TaxID=1538023 RepID=UPI002350FDAC|nr:L-histidine N(alpha)-methyltransferase [Aureisphaera galaxeae]MDC8003341.1 L-histidine N(alpha)-methyltransferase [Aureisphaera galaxeae]
MNPTTPTMLDTAFKKDVFEGLSSFPKYLYSKYIYDAQGDKLFQDIMALPEYYLTNCEFEILDTHKGEIASLFRGSGNGFDLIELGAGDGQKTKVLLRYFAENQFSFVYKPIDISQNAIDDLTASLAQELPSVQVDPEKGMYFEVLNRIKQYNERKKVLMVLGSNIGNLLHPKAIEFLSKLKDAMNPGDLLFMGFDQKKDPQTILDAYNDPTGVTADFNKNLLHRINKELDGNFDTDAFKHWEVYDPETGTAKSYLVATQAMQVRIEALDLTIDFDPWETIHTEISQKYDDKVVAWLANESGLEIETFFSDAKGYYKNYVFRRKEHE